MINNYYFADFNSISFFFFSPLAPLEIGPGMLLSISTSSPLKMDIASTVTPFALRIASITSFTLLPGNRFLKLVTFALETCSFRFSSGTLVAGGFFSTLSLGGLFLSFILSFFLFCFFSYTQRRHNKKVKILEWLRGMKRKKKVDCCSYIEKQEGVFCC